MWFVFAAPVGFFIYMVASIAETNRAPFDLPEAESELVAGYMTEYSGFRWALYFLAEYTNMVVVASIATTLFLGGWLRPFAGTPAFNFLDYFPSLLMLGVGGYCFYRAPKQPVKVQKMFMVAVGLLCWLLAHDSCGAADRPRSARMLPGLKPGLHGAFWFLLKVGLYIYLFMWLRFTFPRYRFDQLMRLGWQFLIPLSIVNVMGIGVALVLHRHWGWSHWTAFPLTTVLTLLWPDGSAGRARRRIKSTCSWGKRRRFCSTATVCVFMAVDKGAQPRVAVPRGKCSIRSYFIFLRRWRWFPRSWW